MSGSVIKDIKLAPAGWQKINWVKEYMPVLKKIDEKFSVEKPLAGKNMVVTIHLEAKTAYMALVLKNAGASVAITGSNPLSTQDEIAAALVEADIKVYATHNCTNAEYDAYIDKAIDIQPDLIIDDGGDLVAQLHGARKALAGKVIGGSEETTTGVHRLRSFEKTGRLAFPMIAVNDAYCKYLFDNRYGTGQSAWDGILRTTNLVVAGKRVVVAGYGWCGKGVAMRAKGLGANVIVTEIDPIKAVEAAFDGFTVLPMKEAAKIGDIFITVTGCTDVLTKEHFTVMKNGVILANAGHFDVEINKNHLAALSVKDPYESRKNILTYTMPDGRRINLLGEGRLVNLACGDGHPAEIMDLSFTMQVLSMVYLLENAGKLENRVYNLPDELSVKTAQTKLAAMNTEIDILTKTQKEYMGMA
ncbi:MAG: adenosylhomocysteinase [Acidaminococcales bacterium]|jgi:adenosylhomocysteinase|nr:adenosylhomocysteinase [Acidaminococcales bacterium]